MEIEFVTDLEEIKRNIKQFNDELNDIKVNKNLIKTLSQFRHWYFIKSVGFGPSKYIGYKNQNSEKYTKHRQMDLDGRDTQEVLKKMKLFEEAEDPALFIKLENFLSDYNKKPNKRTRIYVLR